MADFHLGRGDRLQSLVYSFSGGSGRALTGATVKLIMTKQGATVPVVNAAAVKEDESASVRRVRYDWTSGDETAIRTAAPTRSRFWAEFEVTYGDGLKETYPPREPKISIDVAPDLG